MHDPQTLPSGDPPSVIRPVRQAALAFIFVTVALDILALGIIVPVLTPLVLGMVGGKAETAAWYIGVFGTAWAGMQFVAGPVLGALSDRFGRRPVILLSNFGLGLDYIVMALAPNLGWLFLGRIVSGFTAGSIPTAGAYIADVTPPEKRAQGYGLLGAAFGLGFIVGPALGGFLVAHDPRLPFWVSAGLSLANACYGLFVLPESLPRERRAEFSWARANPVAALGLLRSHRELLGLTSVLFAFYLAHEIFPSVYMLYAISQFGLTPRTASLLLSTAGICSALTQGVLIRKVIARVGERGAILAGSVCGVLGFAVYGLATRGWMFWLAVPLCALWGLAGPPTQSIMSRRVLPTEQGRLQGALGSLRGFAGMIGPGIFTTTFGLFIAQGWVGMHWFSLPGAPFLLSAGLVFAGLAAAWAASHPPQEAVLSTEVSPGTDGVPSGAIAPESAAHAPSGFTSEIS